MSSGWVSFSLLCNAPAHQLTFFVLLRFVSAPATTERAAGTSAEIRAELSPLTILPRTACCPPVPSATQGLSCDDSLTTNATGRLGRACVVEIGEIVQFTLPPSDAFNIAATVRSAAGEDSGRLLGGRGVVVSGRLAGKSSSLGLSP